MWRAGAPATETATESVTEPAAEAEIRDTIPSGYRAGPKGGTLILLRLVFCVPGLFLLGSAAGLLLLARDAARGRPRQPGPTPREACRTAPLAAALGAVWILVILWLTGTADG